MPKHIQLILSSTLAALFSVSALAAPTLAAPLHPFKTTYKISFEGSVNMSGTTIRSLTEKQPNKWLFQSESSAFLANFEESTAFAFNEEILWPRTYLSKQKVLGRTKESNVRFSWDDFVAIGESKNQTWQTVIEKGVQDKLSYQLQLQLDVAAGKDTMEYRIADKGKLLKIVFTHAGKEQINTPAGTLEAIKVVGQHEKDDRKTEAWFAPSRNYQLIKLFHQDAKDKIYTLELAET